MVYGIMRISMRYDHDHVYEVGIAKFYIRMLNYHRFEYGMVWLVWL